MTIIIAPKAVSLYFFKSLICFAVGVLALYGFIFIASHSHQSRLCLFARFECFGLSMMKLEVSRLNPDNSLQFDAFKIVFLIPPTDFPKDSRLRYGVQIFFWFAGLEKSGEKAKKNQQTTNQAENSLWSKAWIANKSQTRITLPCIQEKKIMWMKNVHPENDRIHILL